jgi:hypothetical protein
MRPAVSWKEDVLRSRSSIPDGSDGSLNGSNPGLERLVVGLIHEALRRGRKGKFSLERGRRDDEPNMILDWPAYLLASWLQRLAN